MVKSGALTKAEKFYIQQNPENKTVHELSIELDRSPKLVGKYMTEQMPVEQQKAKEEEKKAPKPESPMFKLMGRHKRGEQNVATVMTKAASELADSTRPQRLSNKKIQQAIHRPKE